jgi:ribosomal protein S18 acetylase RimI-like enzyme
MPKKDSAPKIKYIVSDQVILDQIKTLWEELNRLMGERSLHFKEHFAAMTWSKRRSDLLKKAAGGQMRIDIALNAETNVAVGYLVSTVNSEKLGTVESIFISEKYRGLGIGESLMKKALTWMDENGAIEKVLEATVGNEQVYGFYGRFGFLPRQTLLKQVKNA